MRRKISPVHRWRAPSQWRCPPTEKTISHRQEIAWRKTTRRAGSARNESAKGCGQKQIARQRENRDITALGKIPRCRANHPRRSAAPTRRKCGRRRQGCRRAVSSRSAKGEQIAQAARRQRLHRTTEPLFWARGDPPPRSVRDGVGPASCQPIDLIADPWPNRLMPGSVIGLTGMFTDTVQSACFLADYCVSFRIRVQHGI